MFKGCCHSDQPVALLKKPPPPWLTVAMVSAGFDSLSYLAGWLVPISFAFLLIRLYEAVDSFNVLQQTCETFKDLPDLYSHRRTSECSWLQWFLFHSSEVIIMIVCKCFSCNLSVSRQGCKRSED